MGREIEQSPPLDLMDRRRALTTKKDNNKVDETQQKSEMIASTRSSIGR